MNSIIRKGIVSRKEPTYNGTKKTLHQPINMPTEPDDTKMREKLNNNSKKAMVPQTRSLGQKRQRRGHQEPKQTPAKPIIK